MTKTLTVDVESTSTVNLAKAGAAVYWAHPDTKIICVCFAVDDGPVHTWVPGDAFTPNAPLLRAGGYRIVAHNYLFEKNAWLRLTSDHGWPFPPDASWDCTMARALYWGLPAGLDKVCEALALPVQIDRAKKSRMSRTGRPRTLKPLTWWHETDPVRHAEILADCVNDVEAERHLDRALPPLPNRERQIFLLDGAINQRGVQCDLDMVAKLRALTRDEGLRLNAEMAAVTQGRVTTTNQVARILTELEHYAVHLPDLSKATVKDALKDQTIATGARTILKLRQEAAKASTGKLVSMEVGAAADGRLRGLLQYGGAGRTLRWAGRRVQPQNYPRGSVKSAGSAFGVLEHQPNTTADELSGMLPPGATVMELCSSMLRGCLIARPGHVLVSGDLSQIEARVVAWLAGQTDLLDVFRLGNDVYVYTANKIGSQDRQLGKVLVLACGFGMGAQKFVATALTYGLKLTDDQGVEYVGAWRAANKKIVSFWYDCDDAFRVCAEGPHGTERRVGRVLFRKTRKAVRITLPSGREMVYQNAEIEPADTDAGTRSSITFMGVDPKTKAWTRQRTYGGKIVENIVQATARDVMGEAMLAVDAGRDIERVALVGTNHDELLGEAPAPRADRALAFVLDCMRVSPAWAPGLPVNAEGWIGKRYRK